MTTINAELMVRTINYVFNAHDSRANTPSKRFRKWDGKTPYGVHPTWAALTILTETAIDERLRIAGFWTLLNHDLYEDTAAELILPNDPLLRAEVGGYVRGMTKSPGESKDDEFWRIHMGRDEVKLFCLYDKLSNLLDGSWMDAEKRGKCCELVRTLSEAVSKAYGELNVVRMARAIAV